MEAHAENEQMVSSIYTGTMPATADTTMQDSTEGSTEEPTEGNQKKAYHYSAMYAASMWHNTVHHVRAHSHKAPDM